MRLSIHENAFFDESQLESPKDSWRLSSMDGVEALEQEDAS